MVREKSKMKLTLPLNICRDTLAFVILHLMRVSQSPATKMPVHNLAKVFGPTIIGYSSPEPEAMQVISCYSF